MSKKTLKSTLNILENYIDINWKNKNPDYGPLFVKPYQKIDELLENTLAMEDFIDYDLGNARDKRQHQLGLKKKE